MDFLLFVVHLEYRYLLPHWVVLVKYSESTKVVKFTGDKFTGDQLFTTYSLRLHFTILKILQCMNKLLISTI